MPPDITLPGNLAQSELAESMLMPLVNQFSLMQQQMFDQFHQVILMMFQMFGTLHRDQMGLVREDLEIKVRSARASLHASGARPGGAAARHRGTRDRSRAETASARAADPPDEN